MTAPPPRRRSVDDVAAPYANYLVRVPPDGEGVCAVCHSSASKYATCFPRHDAKRVLGRLVADVTAFVSIAPRGEQLAYELISYKNTKISEVHRQRMTVGLAAVLWKWLHLHERCVAGRIGVERFDLITTVPSTSGRETHPLGRLVAGVVSGTADRYEDLLTVHRTDLDQRAQATDRYRAMQDVTGLKILVIDDTWTTGAHAQSASAALKASGGKAVGVVAIGRWFNPAYGEGASWLAEHRKPGWDWTCCCLETSGAQT